VQASADIGTNGGEQPNDSALAERGRQDKKQQKVAINAWQRRWIDCSIAAAN
jgi:hypothetical protein